MKRILPKNFQIKNSLSSVERVVFLNLNKYSACNPNTHMEKQTIYKRTNINVENNKLPRFRGPDVHTKIMVRLIAENPPYIRTCIYIYRMNYKRF